MAKKNRLIIFGVLLLAVIVLGGTTVYFAQKASKMSTNTVENTMPVGSTATSTLEDAGNVIAAVNKLILLPTDEEPTIATVSDPSKLSDQPFFNNSKVGDKVLIYQKARKAYLYSVTDNRLVDVAPITVGESGTTTPATATPTVPAKSR